MSVSPFKWVHFIMLNYHSVLQNIFTMYSEFPHSQSSISQTLMSNFSQMGPQRFIRCYFQMLRQTTHNYYDDSYYYGSKCMTHWEPRERACDANCWGQNCFTRGCSPKLTSAFVRGHCTYWSYLCTLGFLSYCPAPLQCPNSGHFVFTYCSGSQPS